MSRAQAAANDVKQGLDIALAMNLDLLKQNGQLDTYLQNNMDRVLNNIYESKSANISKTIGDLNRSVDTQKNTYYYYQRNKDMLTLGKDPINRMKQDADALIHDRDLAQRQYEINQWTSGNREDTLFVYQIIFIAVLVLAFLTSIWKMGFIGAGFVGLSVFVLIAIIILTIINRAQYTAIQRNQRYWNKREFPRAQGPPIPVPDCPSAANLLVGTAAAGAVGYNAIKNAPNTFIGALQSGLGAVGTAANQASAGLNTLRVPQ